MSLSARSVFVIASLSLSFAACTPSPEASNEPSLSATADGPEQGGSEQPPVEETVMCEVDQPWPYPSNSPYVGVHAGPSNNDLVPCTLAKEYTEAWHALKGRAIAQPNTYSPDGLTTYVTTTAPSAGDCTVHAISTETGDVLWCRAYDDATLWSSVEVDEDGFLYFTTGESIISLHPDGADRWAVFTPEHPGGHNGAIGLHFSPDGHIATVTDQGTVLLLTRAEGALLASLDIPTIFGFTPIATADLGISLVDLMPESIQEDFASFQEGDPGVLLGVFTGQGNFSDNTIGIAPSGDLYVVGGGPESTDGALVQIRVGGTPEAPQLSPGWHVPLVASSASSPAISPDGKYVKISDGNSTANFLNPDSSQATTRLMDIAACDANTDADPDPDVCAPAINVPLATGPILGTTPMLADGIHYVYEVQFADLMNDEAADLRAFDGDELLWELVLPDHLQWSSVITVTNEHLVGTATAFTASEHAIFTVELPQTATSELLVIDRFTGEIAFRAPVTDDSTSTVTVGPDRSLYVTMLTLLHTMSVETHPVGGIIRFKPADTGDVRESRAR